jgi:hypothetical protein
MITPSFYGPDGVLRSSFNFSTDMPFRFFTGTMDPDTVDMQVSIQGSPLSSNPDLIVFEGTSFTIPNPSVFTDGLQLLPGENVIEVVSVLSNGQATSAGIINATLSVEKDVRSSVLPPSGIFIERLDRTVKIVVQGNDNPNIAGYNFYASAASGGGTVGYSRINLNTINTGSTVESTTELLSLNIDAPVKQNQDGSMYSDPQYFQVSGVQKDSDGAVIQTDYNQFFEIPESSSHLRVETVVSNVTTNIQYSFIHDRRSTATSTNNPAIPNSAFLTVLDTDPLYYVVTAIYYIDGNEYESVYSQEVSGAPLKVTAAVTTFPTVDRRQIVQDTTASIFRSHPDIDVKPGSVIRDTFIDPFSTEASRIRFILEFLHRAQSFTTLLEIDDPTSSGTALAVNQSPYKQAMKRAFFLSSDTDVQTLIDNAFEHLASKYGKTRKTGSQSRGLATFYTTILPTAPITVPIGTRVMAGNLGFRTTSAGVLSPSDFSSFDPRRGKFAINIYVQAEQPGTSYNIRPSRLKRIESGPSGVFVTNNSPFYGGYGRESNLDLALRANGTLSSVDTGRYRGYYQTAIDQAGVLEVSVVDSGHPLMMRDFDASTMSHIGGKVDVWVRGESLADITDSFAFTFQIVKGGQFEPIGRVQNLKFRAVNAGLSVDNPIMEMLNNPDWGFEFKDETTGYVFDLTDVQILNYNEIQLSLVHNDPLNISLTHIFKGSYRYRTSNKYVFLKQPVRSIRTLVGSVSGLIDPDYVKLFHPSTPLFYGHSIEAGDYMQVIQPTTGSPIPSSVTIDVTGETHTLVSNTEYLNSLGINPITVRVYSLDRTIEYYGPYHNQISKDFTFLDEEGKQPLAIVLTDNSRLVEGSQFLVDYSHDENFVIEYTYNSLVGQVQGSLNQERHLAADVLAKEAIAVGVNMGGTIVFNSNYSKTVVDSGVRTALSRSFGALRMGKPERQSDIIDTIDSSTGVSYIVVPMTLLSKSDGSLVVQEYVLVDQESDFRKITDWSSDTVETYLLLNRLNSNTLDGGGQINDSRGVFVNNIPFTNYDTRPNANGYPLVNASNGAFIIGSTGLVIAENSDNATLQA